MLTQSRVVLAFLISTFTVSVATAAAAAISLATNITDHGDPNQACGPPKTSDIMIFFLGNYVAHALTVATLPGETTGSAAFTAFVALLFPTAGIYRGLSAIRHRAIFGKTDLHKAARAGALCMVVRTQDWKPQAGDVAWHAIYRTGIFHHREKCTSLVLISSRLGK